jgi:hypothetical protein
VGHGLPGQGPGPYPKNPAAHDRRTRNSVLPYIGHQDVRRFNEKGKSREFGVVFPKAEVLGKLLVFFFFDRDGFVLRLPDRA